MIDHGVGFYTGIQTMLAEGEVGDKIHRTRHRSLRMDASPRFRGSALQARKPRCKSWSNAPYLPLKSTAMAEDSGDGESSQN
jgi:hypothetical protein